MTAIAIDRETRNYWDMVKSASYKAKLNLLTLLSASIADDEIVVEHKPLKAYRLNTISDEDMEKEMQGEPVPISIDSVTSSADIIDANKGRIIKGLDKWL